MKKRNLVAGLSKYYAPSEQMNRQVIILANLESSKIHCVLYEGMMREVGCSAGEDVALLTINKMVPNGSKVE